MFPEFAVHGDDPLLGVPDVAAVELALVVGFLENGVLDVLFQQQVGLIADELAELFGRVDRLPVDFGFGGDMG